MINAGVINGFEINGVVGGSGIVSVLPVSLTLTPAAQTIYANVDLYVTAGTATLNLTPIDATVSVIVKNDILETAVITSEAYPVAIYDVTETAVITNPEPTIVRVMGIPETAVITNPEPIQVLSDLVTETAVIFDSAYAATTRTQDVEETAAITSAVSMTSTEAVDVTETAVITSNVTQSDPTADITETAVITSAVTFAADGVLDVTDTAVITSSVDPLLSELVSETAVITSAVSEDTTAVLDIVETAVIISNTTSVGGIQRYDVTETAVITSEATPRSDVVTDIVEEGFISSAVVVDGDDVWTANTITWAMSTYTGLSMTGATDTYAVSADGLFVKATSYADMNISTGHESMGSTELKAVPYAYTYAEHDSPLNIAVTADVRGNETTEEYRQMSRDADDTRAVRCTLGRGFRSSYYKLNFTSSGYAQIRKCVPVVDDLTRRI
jgi:hypothetical protein